MLLDRAGRFGMYGKSFAVGEKNGKTVVNIEFSVATEYLNKMWVQIAEDISLWKECYIEKNDGTLNTSTIDQLKRAFGWDGRDVFWFEDTDLSAKGVQADVEADEYKGVVKYKIAWLHSGESDPDRKSKKSTDAERRALNARLGAKLRAFAGAAPAVAPTPAPPAPPTPTDAAWEIFRAKCPKDFTVKQCEVQWFTALEAIFPSVRAEDLTVEQWARFDAESGKHIIPF